MNDMPDSGSRTGTSRGVVVQFSQWLLSLSLSLKRWEYRPEMVVITVVVSSSDGIYMISDWRTILNPGLGVSD